jgi:hypothetical protein
MRKVLGFAAVTMLWAVSMLAQKGEYNTPSKAKAGEFAQSVSIIQLIANPDRYDGKRVRIIGYLHFGQEEEVIFLHKEDSDQLIDANAIWINLPNDLSTKLAAELNKHYVHCEGLFSAKSHGHMGVFPGELTDVRWISPSLSREELDKLLSGQQH